MNLSYWRYGGMELDNNFCGVNLPATNRPGRGASVIAIPQRYCVVDIETTGLSPRWDNIIEIGAIRYVDGVEGERFQSLIQPEDCEAGTYVNDFIEKLTGITNDMLADAPHAVDVLPHFLDFLGDDIILGYNVSFDVNFLYDKCEVFLERTLTNHFVDVMRLAKKLCPDLPRYRLKDVAAHYDLENTQAHRALGDCETTERVYRKLCGAILEKYNDYEQFIQNYENYVDKADNKRSLDLTVDESKIGSDCPLFQRHFVITGTLDRFTRAQAMQLIEDLGGINEKTVNKRTNYLILGNNDYCATIKDGKSTKQKKAEALMLDGQDIEIIPETVFYDMIAEYIAESKPCDANGEEKIAEHYSNVILNVYPGAEITFEDRSENYRSLCVNGTDIMRFKYTKNTQWISIDAWSSGLSKDDPRFADHANKAQRHWKAHIKSLNDLSAFDDAVVAAVLGLMD